MVFSKLKFRRNTVFLFTFLVLSDCSTLSTGPQGPAEAKARITGVSDIERPRFPDITAIRPHWQAAAGSISVSAGRIREGRLDYWALRIDLDGGPGNQMRIVAGGGGDAAAGHVLSTYVSSFVRDQGLWAGINAVPFDPSSAREGEDRRVAGLAVSAGRVIAPPTARFDALVFYGDRGAAIVSQGDIDSSGPVPQHGGRDILHAAGGFHRILRDGELTERARQRRAGPRHARSAAGLSGNGRILYLIAINGGFPGRAGATEAETALILKALGAQDALNLDGGGSAALALRFPADGNTDSNANGNTDSNANGNADGNADGAVRILNTPAHAGFPGRERAVAVCLGFGP
ncbi:MAG: phosphodiester glycosidase family protein [Treponema sp.]|jgi:hypothetical protein|nr:phosphodiester glycosidase family protein [Treponema sp.]